MLTVTMIYVLFKVLHVFYVLMNAIYLSLHVQLNWSKTIIIAHIYIYIQKQDESSALHSNQSLNSKQF